MNGIIIFFASIISTLGQPTEVELLEKKVSVDCSADLRKDLAIAYFKEQEQEKALIAYLEALESLGNPLYLAPVTVEEQKILDQIMTIYLDHKMDSQEMARTILDGYEPLYVQHPEYVSVGFFLAAARANLEEFPEFFEVFFRCYRMNSQHYMAYKTKAILYSKLFLRARTPREREKLREKIHSNVMLALAKESRDLALHKLLLKFSAEKNKPEVIETLLKKILAENMVLQRADISFFVEKAILYDKRGAALKLLERGMEWYPGSRLMEQLNEYAKGVKN